jgi:hypothetical protein
VKVFGGENMHLETLDYSIIKSERESYKENHGNSKNFDGEFISHLEHKYGIRFIGVRRCQTNANLIAYKQDGLCGKTITIPVTNYLDHETTARFVKSAGKHVSSLARLNPKDISDTLTKAARNQIFKPNDVYMDVANINRSLLKAYVLD